MLHTHLPFFAVVRVSGDDRHSFLHGQLSNDINNLKENQACYATYNSPKGRVIANMLVVNTGTELMLAMAADLVEPTVKRLKMFVLRAKVVFEIDPNWGVAAKLPENSPIIRPETPALSFPLDQTYAQLPHGGQIALLPAAELPAYDAAAETAFRIHEIRCGYPWISAATSESCVAQMLNQHIIGGVHFRKGCYPGQEVVARAQYRGQVKRGLALAICETPLALGSKICTADGEEAGIVINAAEQHHLLVIKHAAAQQALHSENGTALALQNCFFETNLEA